MATLTKNQLQTLAQNQSERLSGYTVTNFITPYPFTDFKTGEVKIATAFIMHHSYPEETKEHTTVIAYDGDNYSVWCGDKMLEGKTTTREHKELVAEVLATVPVENHCMVEDDLLNLWNGHDLNSGCSNARLSSNLTRALDAGKDIEDISSGNTAVVCKHIKNMFAQMPEIETVTKDLEKMYKNIFKVSRVRKTDSAIADALDNFGFQGEALFIAGPGGHGKTHTVKSIAEDKGYEFVELQGHGQIEAIDMYGYDKKHGDLHVWFDGPISQAARLAASGKKTMLFIDEIVNIPMRETAGLKAAFEPYKGHYYFQTSRVKSVTDGIAVMEEIKVPVENLQIVAAANIGRGYASEDLDRAFKQRFMIIYYEAENSKVRNVLTSICKEKGFKTSLVEKLMNFKKIMEQKVEEGMIEEAATMRHLSRKFLVLMKDEADLEEIALAQTLQFVEFDVDGKPVAEQVEMVEEIIEMTLA